MIAGVAVLIRPARPSRTALRAVQDKTFNVWPRYNGRRAFSLGSPGHLRAHLTKLVLEGVKVATAGILQQEHIDEGEPIEAVGEVQVLLGDEGRPVALVEITRVEVHPFALVPWEFAQAEGEGFESIEDWRAAHLRYYTQEQIPVTENSEVVCVWFRVIGVPEGEA
jgi:uncharacterized protein YhfF